ncbi:MAG: hypothetical protein PHX07_07500, partial [Candidatus Marinimicrobia bacterium]|nr:hypothetical protein [Candidatus Neomarinimicrobiota bacterium]
MIPQMNKERKIATAVVAVVLLAVLLYFFSPMIFKGLRPSGVDISASRGSTNLYLQYQKESGGRVLWNPNIFAGMPLYPRITPSIVHVDTIINKLDKIAYSFFWYYLAGALGLFFLLRYKKLPWYVSLIAALALILLPHWIALLHVGHFAKLRAFMIIPWLILSFNYLIDKRSWLAVGLFAAAFSWITRTQHVQVVFYGILALIFLFLVPVFRPLFRKEWKRFGDLALKILTGTVLTVVVASQPFMSLQEYTPHSTRGGNAVQMELRSESTAQDKGVGLDYATRWSLDGKGILAFFIPRFSGGLSQEIYNGNRYPQLNGRAIPGYWGEMPFTQSYDFVGMLVFLFALIGIIKYWKKDGFVRSLTVFSGFALLLALGRHFLPLYKLLYQVVPYFSKFRVPSMIVNMIFIVLIILAAYGIRAAFEAAKNKEWKLFAGVFGAAAGSLLLILLFSGGFSYELPGEATRYGAQTLELIRNIRKDFLQADTLKTLLLVLAGGGLMLARSFQKLKTVPAYILLGLLIAVEIFPVSHRAYKQMPLENPATAERREFRQTNITRYLQSRPQTDRAMALGQDSNHYSYFYPTISGYSAIKLQTIQDLREHCLFVNNRLNWSVVNMLSGRYIIAPGRLEEDFLIPAALDETRGEILYVNENALPKAWFVKELKRFPAFNVMLQYMNSNAFNPAETALLPETAAVRSAGFSGTGSIEVLEYTPDRIRFSVSAETPQFAVFSEMYYPEGWELKKDSEDIAILQTNYALRGAELPAGEYTLEMRFHPRSYFAGMKVVWIGDVIMLLLIAAPLLWQN